MSERRSESESEWPAVSFEEHPWVARDDLPAARSARRLARGPYRAAVPALIARRSLVLPSSIAASAEDAAGEVARFDEQMGREIAPFAAVLLRSESAASSKIEQLTASARAIAEAELGGNRSGNAPFIVANVRAMNAAVALADRIDAGAILAMHSALLRDQWPEVAGRWRSEQVWIGGSDISPHGAVFVPPHHDRVRSAIADLMAFIARDDIPVLAQAALAHAQFETIHPFPDGNGRTGRALLHAQLRNKGLTRNVTVPISAGLLADTGAYFDDLTAYRVGDHLAIVERLIAASFAAVDNGGRLVRDLRTIREQWNDLVVARRHATTWRLADLLLRQPVVNRRVIADELSIAPENVYRVLQPLVDADVLVEVTDKKRNQMWRCQEVLDALDAFATRAGRRRRAR